MSTPQVRAVRRRMSKPKLFRLMVTPPADAFVRVHFVYADGSERTRWFEGGHKVQGLMAAAQRRWGGTPRPWHGFGAGLAPQPTGGDHGQVSQATESDARTETGAESAPAEAGEYRQAAQRRRE